MKRLLFILLAAGGVLRAAGAEVDWVVDFDAARETAQRENKFIMLDFTGSDWCGWCKKLKAEVFDQPEFAEFARQHLVTVEVDFPRNIVLSPSLIEANEQLQKTYQIRGFPTIVLLDPSGRKVASTGYQPGGPKPFIATLEHYMSPGAVAAKKTSPSESTPPNSPPPKAPSYAPIRPTAPVVYDRLALKALSGPPERRLAMINNELFLVGDTAKVKVRDGRVEVRCDAIRDNSVLVTIDGQQVELKMGVR